MKYFVCPACKRPLETDASELRCSFCGRAFKVIDGVPDFFISEQESEAIDEPNKTWLDPETVELRDTVYRLSARELKGMAFCMQEIGQRTAMGCRILEVGVGTGHFTRWLAEAAKPGTEVYSFDFSWPILEKAKTNTAGLTDVILLRANARGLLPFPDEMFDVVLVRLAPLGAGGKTKVQAAYELLKPGGWYFEAGWAKARYETSPTEWAMQHGYEHAAYHEWQYWRRQSLQEATAARAELDSLAGHGCVSAQIAQRRERKVGEGTDEDGSVESMTSEYVLMAQKPGS